MGKRRQRRGANVMFSSSENSQESPRISTSERSERICKARNEDAGDVCGETETLRILNVFRSLYESRIEKVDREFNSETERIAMKLKITMDWINDLGEQNAMLVRVVEELEEAAISRVKLLEEKLIQTTSLISDSMTNSQQSEALNALSDRIQQLQKNEEQHRQEVEYLQSDIRGLLELIRRAREENRWSLNDITFLTIQPEDIPLGTSTPTCIEFLPGAIESNARGKTKVE